MVFIFCLVILEVRLKVIDMEVNYKKCKEKYNKSIESINLLRIEWEYLNNPQRLQILSERYLNLKPVEKKQIININLLLLMINKKN